MSRELVPQPELFPDIPTTTVTAPNFKFDAMFDEFWSRYPRKVDKIAARKAFDRVLRNRAVTFAELMAGVVLYAHDRWIENEPQFTKHAASWLNAGSWANEPLHSGAQQLRAKGAVSGAAAGIDAFFERRNSDR